MHAVNSECCLKSFITMMYFYGIDYKLVLGGKVDKRSHDADNTNLIIFNCTSIRYFYSSTMKKRRTKKDTIDENVYPITCE